MPFNTHKKILLSLFVCSSFISTAVMANNDLASLPQKDRIAYFNQAEQANITGVAIKTKPVLARPAKVGEIVVTEIKGEGVETVSEPAKEGDWVVQNICPQTGNEEILVRKEKFAQRYHAAQANEANEANKVAITDNRYSAFIPNGNEMNYFIIPESTSDFAMKAPWGELQRFQSGDAVVQSTIDKQDVYRIQKAAFECTYTIIQSAKPMK